jgi:hypothetical protein
LVASDASAQSSCSKIADDKERLACFDKGATVEQNAAPIEKTPRSRTAFRSSLHKWFLENGYSFHATEYEKGGDNVNAHFDTVWPKQRHHYPRLVVCCDLSEPLTFRLAGKAGLLKGASLVGFKSVVIMGSGYWLFDVSNGEPPCDVNRRLCL